MTKLSVVLLTCLFGSSVAVPLAGAQGNAALSGYITSIPKLDPVAAQGPAPSGPAGPDTDFGIINRRRHLCNITPMSQADNFIEVVALDPNAGTIWPGALFQGSSLQSGRLTPITLPRSAGTVTVINLTKTGNGATLFTRPVRHPSFAASQQVLQSLTSDRQNLARQQPADMTLSIATVHSFEQALLDVGVSASWMTGSAAASLKSASEKHHNGLVVKFVQRYYSLRFNDPATPSSFFDRRVKIQDIKAVAHPAGSGISNDPPMYISEVKYGRMLLLSVSSDQSADSLETAVRASISAGLAGGTGHVDATSKHILESSEIEGLVLGGSAAEGATLLSSLIGGNIDNLPAFIRGGATYDPSTSPGYPISYTARYLKDNSVADSSFTADFSSTGCRDEDVPITRGRISFQVGNDDKDDEMYPFITLSVNGAVKADANGLGTWDNAGHAKWDDHSPHGPFTFDIKDLNYANCPGLRATVGQRSTRGSNPGWRTSVKIELLANNSWFIAKDMNPNSDEFTWGDNHSNQDSFQLACPQ